MNWIHYKGKLFFLNIFILMFLSGCSSTSPSRYSQLDIFDLVASKENRIHSSRVAVLNEKIENVNVDINYYKNKIRATKQAIDNVKIEVSSYNSLIESASNKVKHINQLHGFLNQVDMRIKSIENEFDRVKNISKGLEKITHSEFLSLRSKGYFSNLTWSDYLEIVEEVIEAKKKIDRELKEARKRTRYARSNPSRTFKLLGRGAWKVFKRLSPIGRVIDVISTIWGWFS